MHVKLKNMILLIMEINLILGLFMVIFRRIGNMKIGEKIELEVDNRDRHLEEIKIAFQIIQDQNNLGIITILEIINLL